MFGRMRLNHLVLEVRDLKRWQAFAGDFLGLPLFDMPVRKRLQHFMLETNDLTDVGMVWERAKRLGIPITLDLGQHPAPDGTISFHGRTPSGSEFEIGSGLYEVEDAVPETFNVTSAWGHQPSLAAKLRMASVFVGERIGL